MQVVEGRFEPYPEYENYPAVLKRAGAEAFASSIGGELPTEAQWEYAARAFEPGDYPWGDDSSCDFGNIATHEGPCSDNDSVPVGSYGPNGFGLYDVCGNACELCRDWFDLNREGQAAWGKTYYEWCLENYPHGVVDPQGPDEPPPGSEVTPLWPHKVVRSGSPDYSDDKFTCMLWGRRLGINPVYDGCRVVIEPPK